MAEQKETGWEVKLGNEKRDERERLGVRKTRDLCNKRKIKMRRRKVRADKNSIGLEEQRERERER